VGVRLNGQLVYADILVIDERNDRVQKAAEVETVVDDESVRRLILASRIAPSVYVYVVDGYGEKTKRILEDQQVYHVRVLEYYISPLGNLIVRQDR
jgi:hypothetical protein